MPFGVNCEYKDFDECVDKNRGKESPEGYCATLMETTEGKCAMRETILQSYRSVASYKANLVRRIQNMDPVLGQQLRAMKFNWYTVQNQAETEDSADVFIYDEIGGSFGIDANEFVQELNALDVVQINVRINSPGGNAFDAIAIYNSLVAHPAYVHTYVDSLAASAASIIAMAGDEVIMMRGGQIMIHDALSPEIGNAADHRAVADFLDKQSNNIATIYAAKAGGEPDEWRTRMLAETWVLADEAVEIGLADKVFEPTKKDAPKPSKPAPKEDAPPTIEPEEDEESEFAQASAAMLRELMSHQHKLVGRGFKYAGRNNSPSPLDTDETVYNMFDTILKG